MCRLRHDRRGYQGPCQERSQRAAGRKGRGGKQHEKLLGVVALVYVLPVVGFLLGYFLSEGLLEGWRYGIAVAAAVLAFLPSVAYDRYARRKELLTYTILRVF